MAKLSKRFKEIEKIYDPETIYSIDEAVELLQKAPKIKFDQSLEISINMGIDPKKTDQQVRGTVALPNGTGKDLRVLVFAKGDKAEEAKEAGAEFVGSDDLVDKIKGGWTDFDVIVTTPDMMREVGKLGKILGPRGLMPTPKAGTVTMDIKKTVEELKAGKIEFKNDKHGVLNNAVGKLSFAKDALIENIKSYIAAVQRMKPATSKGTYLKSCVVSSTMGPGIKIQIRDLEAA